MEEENANKLDLSYTSENFLVYALVDFYFLCRDVPTHTHLQTSNIKKCKNENILFFFQDESREIHRHLFSKSKIDKGWRHFPSFRA